jgi:hypothetical protein
MIKENRKNSFEISCEQRNRDKRNPRRKPTPAREDLFLGFFSEPKKSDSRSLINPKGEHKTKLINHRLLGSVLGFMIWSGRDCIHWEFLPDTSPMIRLNREIHTSASRHLSFHSRKFSTRRRRRRLCPRMDGRETRKEFKNWWWRGWVKTYFVVVCLNSWGSGR